jgi:serine/threonine protein kinase
MMHRDLKSPNILLSEEGVAKIADVGMVRSQVNHLVTAQPVMTPLWAAPEVGMSCAGRCALPACDGRPCSTPPLLPQLPPRRTTAPVQQVVRHERACIKADIWSYGILIFELASGQDITEFQPLSVSRRAGPAANSKAMMVLPPACPTAARKLFAACTQVDPEQRPTAQQLVEWLRADMEGR